MQFRYSSIYDSNHKNYKINNAEHPVSAWCSSALDNNQYVEGYSNIEYKIVGILIQGRGNN